MSARIRFFALILAAVLCCGSWSQASAQRRRNLKIKLGTVAPKNSVWHEVLLDMRQDWREISGGAVDLVIYPGGVTGDEETMLRKMRAGQIQAALMSGSGMAYVDNGVSALQVPFTFDSLEEFDYVRQKIQPDLEARIEAKNYKVLHWSEAGWAHLFAVRPFETVDDVRKMKLYTSKGDERMLRLYGDLGFHAVPLDLTELQTALETRMVEAFVVPPLVAAGYQWFGSASYMLSERFLPIVGATLIDKETWDRIPPEQQKQMLASASRAGAAMQQAVRAQGEQAIAKMQEYGLNVIPADAETTAAWVREVEAAYPKMRGSYAPGDMLDEVRRLRNEYRSRRLVGNRAADNAGNVARQ